jgi:hypothetical protein
LIKEKREISKFVIVYLRYLVLEDLNKLIEELENSKKTESNTSNNEKKEENNTVVT